MDKKVERVIDMYKRLCDGYLLVKSDEANRFHVNERTIQRDLDDIRAYFDDNFDYGRELVYDRAKKGYMLVRNSYDTLTNSEVLAVCKILVESRSLVKEEMMPIIDKLLKGCVPFGEMQKMQSLIANEKFHYLEPHHGKKFVDKMWDIGSAVQEHKLMKIRYSKLTETDSVMRLVQPVGIMFSEYYFYLAAFICESEEMPDVPKRPFPTIYRMDRIEEYEVLNEHFHVPYAERFEEGEFRKRVQFMFGGELRTIKFRYKGLSLEAVLDRLPTAEVIEQDEDGYLIRAEVYGSGIDMWLRSQGDNVEVVE